MKRIAFLTDIHLAEQFPADHNVDPKRNWEKALADLHKRNIDEIVFGGDIGTGTSHQWFFETLQSFTVHLVLGNHDNFSEICRHYKPLNDKEELYYCFEDECFKYIFLDSSSNAISSIQLAWLQQELKTGKSVLLFVHHPIIEINTAADRLYPLKNRKQVKAVLLESKVKITIFCGHYHMNDERAYLNIKQFTTQALSFQLEKNAAALTVNNTCYGYRIIQLEKHKIDTEIVTLNHTDHIVDADK